VTKVLYVEHTDDNLYMLKTRLELLGDFEVLTAEDSDKGCKLAVTERPDVILMDLEMPVTDRWESVRRLKKDPQTRDIPIIGMSARTRWPANATRPSPRGVTSSTRNPLNSRVWSRPFGACLRTPNRCSLLRADEPME
jgi:CheY-like chemotaxis protein